MSGYYLQLMLDFLINVVERMLYKIAFFVLLCRIAIPILIVILLIKLIKQHSKR